MRCSPHDHLGPRSCASCAAQKPRPQARQVRSTDASADTRTRPNIGGLSLGEIERLRRLRPVALHFCNVAKPAVRAALLRCASSSSSGRPISAAETAGLTRIPASPRRRRPSGDGLAHRPEGQRRALAIRASSGCTDRTHRGTSIPLRSAVSRGTSANVARRTEPTSRCSSPPRPFQEAARDRGTLLLRPDR